MVEEKDIEALNESYEQLFNSYIGTSMADQAVLASVLALFAASGTEEETAQRLNVMKAAAMSFLQTPLSDKDMPASFGEIIKARVDATYSFASKFKVSVSA